MTPIESARALVIFQIPRIAHLHKIDAMNLTIDLMRVGVVDFKAQAELILLAQSRLECVVVGCSHVRLLNNIGKPREACELLSVASGKLGGATVSSSVVSRLCSVPTVIHRCGQAVAVDWNVDVLMASRCCRRTDSPRSEKESLRAALRG